MIVKNKCTLFVVMCMVVVSGRIYAGSFLIKKKALADDESGSWSRTKLQEEIGNQVKDVFTTTIAMTQELGSLQVSVATALQTTDVLSSVLQKNGHILQELGSLQRLCSRVLEGLVDDHILFKKSHKKELELMHERIQSCSLALKQQHAVVKNMVTTAVAADKSAFAVEDASMAKQQLTTCLAELTKQTTTLTNDCCVKKL